MHHELSREEIARAGQEVYDRDLRHRLEPEHRGEFVAIDAKSGEYCINTRALDAIHGVKAKHADANVFLIRIGYRTAYRLGGRARVKPRSP